MFSRYFKLGFFGILLCALTFTSICLEAKTNKNKSQLTVFNIRKSLDYSSKYSKISEMMIYFYLPSELDKNKFNYYYQGKSDLGISNNLNLKQITWIADNAASHFLSNAYLPRVELFILHGMGAPCNLEWIAKGCPNLKTLHVKGDVYSGPEYFDSLAQFTSLEDLKIHISDPDVLFDQHVLDALTQLPQLKNLELRAIYKDKSTYDKNIHYNMQRFIQVLPHIKINFKVFYNVPETGQNFGMVL